MAEPAKVAMKGSGAIRFLDGVDRLVGRICKFTVMTTGVVLLFTIIIGVIARYVIDVGGVDWAEELPKQIFPWFIMAGVVLALQTGNHIAVDLIYNHLNGPSKRVLVVTTNLFLCGAYAYLCLTALDVAEIAALEQGVAAQAREAVTPPVTCRFQTVTVDGAGNFSPGSTVG